VQDGQRDQRLFKCPLAPSAGQLGDECDSGMLFPRQRSDSFMTILLQSTLSPGGGRGGRAPEP